MWSTLFVVFLCSSQAAAQQPEYDYIIVGGGTAGLTVAARLSEIEDVSVLVVEAGNSAGANWDYQSQPQTYTGGSIGTLPAGKAIGGSSTINGMVYLRADDLQIDDWEKAGNQGWNWDALWPYYLKSEQIVPPTQAQVDAGVTYTEAYHGTDGPVNTGWSAQQANTNYLDLLRQTYEALGIPNSDDPNGGSMRGISTYPKTLQADGRTREDAGSSYYSQSASRANLDMLADTTVLRILWESDQPEDEAVATGVEVQRLNGDRETYNATKEIIVSAGTYKTPTVLEYSGVGNPDILSRFGIDTKIELPGVGENLMDQINNQIEFAAAPGTAYSGPTSYVAYANITDIYGPETAAFAESVRAALPSYAAAIADQNNGATSAADMQTLLEMHHKLVFDAQVPMLELLKGMQLGETILCEFWGTLPFARGNVHISADDGLSAPAINNNFYMFDYDVQSQIQAAKFIRTLYATEPLSRAVGDETSPGLDVVPADAADAVWEDWLKSTYRSAWHPIGTAMMLPREMGGVVGERLVVYGTANVRVVDASVMTFQVNGHPSSTVYALAEMASDMIKQDGGLEG